MSLLPNVTYANLETPLWALAGSGGGGGGAAIATSSITVSTITAAGTVESFISGDPTKLAYTWAVQKDGANNSADILNAPSTNTAYRDIRMADATGTPVELLREEISLGSATIGYAPNPAAVAATGIRFISSLNGGASATAVLTSTDRFPLGNAQIATSNTAICPAGAFGVPIAAPFSTLTNHIYQVSFGVQEQVGNGTALGGAVNPEDRVSYSITDAVLDTILHSEISTLQGAQPRGRVVTAIFQAAGGNAQVTISNNTGSLLSTIYTGANNPSFLAVTDMGPAITLP